MSRGIPLMSECVPRRARGQQELPHCTDLTTEDLSKTSSSLWNNMLPTVRLMLVIWQNCLLHHSAAGCWHSHHGVSVISSHPGRWKVVYIEAERQYHMVAPGDRIWCEVSHIKPSNSVMRALSLPLQFKHLVCIRYFQSCCIWFYPHLSDSGVKASTPTLNFKTATVYWTTALRLNPQQVSSKRTYELIGHLHLLWPCWEQRVIVSPTGEPSSLLQLFFVVILI